MHKNNLRSALRRGCLLGLALTLLWTLAAGRYRRAAAAVCADTLRLHILANSDTVADQCAKLRARDALLKAVPPLLQNARTEPQAEAALRRALPYLRRTAQQAAGQPAAVRLQTGEYPAKDYGGFSLPGGRYAALRVELGAAGGHNWFCVLYPALCVGGAVAEYPTKEENALVFGRYKVRLALWDWLRGLQKQN